MFDYQLIRSERRKTLGLQVKQGKVIVRAPHFVTRAFIDDFITSKAVWLNSKVLQQQQLPELGCNFISGSPIYLLGEKYTLDVTKAKRTEVAVVNKEHAEHPETLRVSFTEQRYAKLTASGELSSAVKKALERYFSIQAQNLFTESVKVLSNATGLLPSKLKIRQYKSRWGSCNNRKEVSLNYLLIMAPLWVIDYVIIHELCHLEQLNHSKKFWQLVALHCPDYQLAKQWLVKHQGELSWCLGK